MRKKHPFVFELNIGLQVILIKGYFKSGFNYTVVKISLSLSLSLFFFGLFRGTPMAYGSSQARDQSGAIAAALHHSHSSAGSEPQPRPTPQLAAIPDP